MFIEPTITWVPSGFSGYIWIDTKIVLKKKYMLLLKRSIRRAALLFEAASNAASETALLLKFCGVELHSANWLLKVC